MLSLMMITMRMVMLIDMNAGLEIGQQMSALCRPPMVAGLCPSQATEQHQSSCPPQASWNSGNE